MLQPDKVTAQTRTLRIVWYAMMMGVAVYSLVVWFLIHAHKNPQIDLPQRAQTFAALIIILLLPLANLLRRKLSEIPEQGRAEDVIQRWVTGWIVGMAIRELVGIAGITLALLTGSAPLGIAFSVASVGSMLMSPPWEHELRLRLRNAGFEPTQT